MDPRAAVELLQTAAAATTVARLIYLDLAGQLPALVAYLVFLAGIDMGFGLLDPRSAFYFWTYLVLECLKWIFSVFAIRELFALTFHSYPGIRTIGRWAMYFGVALAVAISLLATHFFWGAGVHRRSYILFYFEVSQRSVVFTLALVIVTILLILSKYPLHLSGNTLTSCIFFSVLYLSEALRLLVDTLAPRLFNPHADWAQASFVAICLLGWAAMLKRETVTVPRRIPLSTPGEEYLLRQLDALNQMMTRSLRR